jgi:Aspartyl/Asparaginyl beta-hydroxylase
LHLLNQGIWNKELMWGDTTTAAWKEVHSLLQHVPGLMDQCLFGNVVISRIHPGTMIEPHCGPTNARHRLQLVLEVPSSSSSLQNNTNMSLLVGPEEQINWNSPDDVFVFDDSFVHSVRFLKACNATIAKNTRTVLIVDLWHPQLSATERSLLQQLYPPFSKKNEATKT